MMAYTFIVNYNQPNLTQMREYAEDLYSLYSDKNKEKIYNFIDNLDVDRYIDREIDLNRLIYLINSFKDIILNFLADHLSYIEKLIPILFVSLSLNEYEQAHLTLEQIDKEIKSNPDFDTSDLIDKLEEVCSMFNLYDFAKYKPELNIKNIQVNIEEFKSIYKRIIDICSTIKTNTKLSIEDLELVNTIVLYSTIMIN